MATFESSIAANILGKLKMRGAMAIKVHGDMYTRIGTPDIIGAYKGYPLAIEIKNEEYNPTERQLHEREKWVRAGAMYALARDWETVKILLDNIDNAIAH